MTTEEALEHFNSHLSLTKALNALINHDYGEAWRDIRVSFP